MLSTALYGPRMSVSKSATSHDHRPDRRRHPLSAACVCGSDLWPYRGIDAVDSLRRWVTSTSASSKRSAPTSRRQARPVRHRLLLRLGQHLRDLPLRLPERAACTANWAAARHPGRVRAHPTGRRHPARHPRPPTTDLIPSLLAASDVLGTGWFAAVAAEAGPGKTVAVVGDGAVGLLGVLAANSSAPNESSP